MRHSRAVSRSVFGQHFCHKTVCQMKRLFWLLGLVCVTALSVLGLGRDWRKTPEKPAHTPVASREIHIEVLNGCGDDGVARAAGDRLRALGFDVITVENAESYNYPETIVIDRVGRPDFARQVGDAIGVANRIQQIVPDPFRIEEVTVVVGGDYRRLGLAVEDRATAIR